MVWTKDGPSCLLCHLGSVLSLPEICEVENVLDVSDVST